MRRELNGAMPNNIDYIGLLIYIYINDKQWRITLIKKITQAEEVTRA